MDRPVSKFELEIRYQIYRWFADNCRAPSYLELAELLHADAEDVRVAFHELHRRHMIFLELGGNAIRMANPFSAVPTRFKVQSGAKAWWANCAWDALGIPAALRLDAHISAAYPDEAGTVEFNIQDGALDGKQHVVYFPLPFRQWYDDLVFT